VNLDNKNNKGILRVVFSSMVGSIMEWYDFYIYGTAAALVFNQLFFPKSSEIVGTILSLSTFAIGFLVRPIGGVIFGALGDRIGRVKVLVITLVLMGSATTLIGLLPTFNTIGYWAPLLLLILRMLQGAGAGAEFAGAVITVAEYSSIKRRGFYSALPYAGVSIGLLLSTGVFAIVNSLPKEQFLSWGWRIPFLLSSIVVMFGMFIRLRVKETPAFETIKQPHQEKRLPFLELFRRAPRKLVLAWAVFISDFALVYIYQTFVTSYVATTLKLPNSVMLTTLTITGFLQIITVPAFGALSDKIGRRRVIIGGALVSALFAFPFFWLVNTRIPLLIGLAVIFASAIARSAIVSAQTSWLCELFDTRFRYSGFAIGREWPSIFGGITPVIASSLLFWSHGQTWIISSLMVLLSLITVVAAFLGPENYQRDLAEDNESKSANRNEIENHDKGFNKSLI
jgi:MFS transporter, MHS family, shikimate and dehydroshikimate transport protein